MAHRESVQNEYSRDYLRGKTFFWNVSSNVGYGYKNKSEDVRLIQFFLNRIMKRFQDRNTTGLKFPAQLKMDGKFGGKTWGAIKFFQKVIDPQCVADGMISPANGKNLYTPKQQMAYTIYLLNGQYLENYWTYQMDIRCDPELPNELLNHLYGPLPDLV